VAFRVPDPDKEDRELKKRQQLRRELYDEAKPLNPGGELSAESKNLILARVHDGLKRQTWRPTYAWPPAWLGWLTDPDPFDPDEEP